jgi:hypothetical protein
MMDAVSTKAALAVLAVACVSCGHLPTRNARIDPALAKLIPPDTTMLLDAHLDRLRQTPVYRKYAARITPKQEIEGLRPDDVAEVLICSDGKNTIAFSRFSNSGVAARLRSSGRNATRYNGIDIYGDPVAGFALLDSDIGAAGPVPALKAAIDLAKRGGGGLPSTLETVLENNAAQDQIQGAMIGPLPGLGGIAADNPNFGNLVRLARSIDSASLGVQMAADVNLHVRADCKSEDEARQVHDTVRGFIALARMTAPASRPELVKVYDALTVTREKNLVRITAAFAEQDLDAVIGLVSKTR